MEGSSGQAPPERFLLLSPEEREEAKILAAYELAVMLESGDAQSKGTFTVTLESGKTALVPYFFSIGKIEGE